MTRANTMYTIMLANSVPSMRSNTPPCPGSSLPISFTPRRRFNTLSTRSPNSVSSEVTSPSAAKMSHGVPAQPAPSPAYP